jgi:GST-like protein
MFQMGGLGPMAGQAHHFRHYAPETIDYAVNRYTNEVRRLYGVMERRLGESEYLAGDYSIADIACWPWVRPHERQGQDLADFPNLKRWFEAIEARPAVQGALEVLAEASGRGKSGSGFDEKAQEILFGNEQYRQH